MTRTLGATLRRRNIADAAGGFPPRAAVVLYACIAPGEQQDDIVTRLRKYAEARDWVIAGTVVDHTTTATPLDSRPNWRQAKALIVDGQARGIVTTSRRACAETASTPVLSEWLDTHNAFLAETTPITPVTEGVVQS
ncbi:hypothetical protein SUDANB1_05696 [Streptomyces sp. enrichment culture]|uniref:hypothetical protein n=1 Tax=Streptomyces sp. enrichment culture TaxID=1795815 RepID=UPI003F54C27D